MDAARKDPVLGVGGVVGEGLVSTASLAPRRYAVSARPRSGGAVRTAAVPVPPSGPRPHASRPASAAAGHRTPNKITPEQTTSRLFAHRGGPGGAAAGGQMDAAMEAMLSSAAETTSASMTSANPYDVEGVAQGSAAAAAAAAASSSSSSSIRPTRRWTADDGDAVQSALTRGAPEPFGGI